MNFSVQVLSACIYHDQTYKNMNDLYYIIETPNEKNKSNVDKNCNLNPNWNDSFILSNPQIKISIWNHDLIEDDLIGEAKINLIYLGLQQNVVENTQLELISNGKVVGMLLLGVSIQNKSSANQPQISLKIPVNNPDHIYYTKPVPYNNNNSNSAYNDNPYIAKNENSIFPNNSVKQPVNNFNPTWNNPNTNNMQNWNGPNSWNINENPYGQNPNSNPINPIWNGQSSGWNNNNNYPNPTWNNQNPWDNRNAKNIWNNNNKNQPCNWDNPNSCNNPNSWNNPNTNWNNQNPQYAKYQNPSWNSNNQNFGENTAFDILKNSLRGASNNNTYNKNYNNKWNGW